MPAEEYGSTEGLRDDFKNTLRVLYHASPYKLDILKGSHTTSGSPGSVCTSPYRAIASLYCINQNTVLEAVERQLGKRVVKSNFGYELWTKDKNDAELNSIPKKVVLTLNIRGFNPVHGESEGYLYTIVYSKSSFLKP